MSRAFGIVCIVSVIYLAALIVGFYSYSVKEQDEIQQILLSHAIDYSSDAAMQEVLFSDNLDMDYSEEGNATIDPKRALDTFLDIFCLNYDLAISNETKKHVLQNYIPVACVACYDGYYIARLQPVKNSGAVNFPLSPTATAAPFQEATLNNSAWDVVFGPKLPYTYINGTTSYALNMGMDYSYAIDGTDISKPQGLPVGLPNKEAGIAEINKIISSAIAYTVDSANAVNPNWQNSFFIPAQLTTISGANAITGPSFIVLVQNVDLTTSRPISGFSVSGTKIGQARMVVGYIRNGIRYYSYADRIPDDVDSDGIANELDDNILDFFSNVKDAAKAEYYYDSKYMN